MYISSNISNVILFFSFRFSFTITDFGTRYLSLCRPSLISKNSLQQQPSFHVVHGNGKTKQCLHNHRNVINTSQGTHFWF